MQKAESPRQEIHRSENLRSDDHMKRSSAVLLLRKVKIKLTPRGKLESVACCGARRYVTARTVNYTVQNACNATSLKFTRLCTTYKRGASCYTCISRFSHEMKRLITEKILSIIQWTPKFPTIQSTTIFNYRFGNMYAVNLQRKRNDFLDRWLPRF